MQVRVGAEALVPSVQEGGEPELPLQPMPGIPSELQQGVRRALKQQVVADPLVLQDQRLQFLGQREHDMKIRQGKQIRLLPG